LSKVMIFKWGRVKALNLIFRFWFTFVYKLKTWITVKSDLLAERI
jgi:hypothetical protein